MSEQQLEEEEESAEASISLDCDAAVEVVAGNVPAHPLLGGVVVRHGVEHDVGDGDHDLDPGAGERAERFLVGVEQLHLLDAVVPEELRHDLGRQRVRGLRAPVHPQRIRRRPRRRHGRHCRQQAEPRAQHRQKIRHPVSHAAGRSEPAERDLDSQLPGQEPIDRSTGTANGAGNAGGRCLLDAMALACVPPQHKQGSSKVEKGKL